MALTSNEGVTGLVSGESQPIHVQVAFGRVVRNSRQCRKDTLARYGRIERAGESCENFRPAIYSPSSWLGEFFLEVGCRYFDHRGTPVDKKVFDDRERIQWT